MFAGNRGLWVSLELFCPRLCSWWGLDVNVYANVCLFLFLIIWKWWSFERRINTWLNFLWPLWGFQFLGTNFWIESVYINFIRNWTQFSNSGFSFSFIFLNNGDSWFSLWLQFEQTPSYQGPVGSRHYRLFFLDGTPAPAFVFVSAACTWFANGEACCTGTLVWCCWCLWCCHALPNSWALLST